MSSKFDNRSTVPTSAQSRKVFVSAFNMYKGGSLQIFDRISTILSRTPNILLFASHGMQIPDMKSSKRNHIKVKYPIDRINILYRFYLEHFYIPILSYFNKCDHLIMCGNFPSTFWFRQQSVLFHNINYLRTEPCTYKFLFERCLFKLLMRLKKPTVLVQTSTVKKEFQSLFPDVRCVIVGTPRGKPNLLRQNIDIRRKPTLIYPAFDYEHKNHQLLFELARQHESAIKDIEILLTIDPPANVKDNFHNIKFLGNLSLDAVHNIYKEVDGILFLSTSESLGLPLVEGCEHGLPVIAPDLDYANSVINSFYSFDPRNADSLRQALFLFLEDHDNNRPKKTTCLILEPPSDFIEKMLS